ncbi:MAG: glycosyl transferase, family 39 [Chloroflexi bacterium]|nr:glycosyl transferase, family 39 [Chloroflexota bacterium]
MLTTERRNAGQQAMAWRASPQSPSQQRTPLEGLSLLALLLPLLVGAILVASLRRETGWTSPLVPLLGVSIICGAGLIYSIDCRRRERPVPGAIRIANTVRPGIAAAISVALSLIAALLTVNAIDPVPAALVWIASMALLLVHALFLERPHLHPPTPIDAIALIGLILLAVLLRLPHLGDMPAFVHSDEAQMGLNMRIALNGGMPSLFGTTDWWSVPWLGPAMQAPLMLFFGEGLTAIRLASVIAGVLATVGLWFLGSEMWSRRAGFVAALLFAVLAPSVHFSRDGVHYMQSVAALVWTVLCYTRATKRYSGAYAALTGILVGVDIQLYYAARLAVPLIIVQATARALLERGLFRNWFRLLMWTGLGVAVTFLPMATFYITHPSALIQRTDAVVIFSQSLLVKGAVAHDYGAAGWFEIIGRQIQRVVLGFLALGDRSEQYGARSALLDPVTAGLLPAACALALARAKQSAWLLCVSWAAITIVLGGVLTTYQPDAPRLLAALPAICLLIGGLAHTLLATAGETGSRDAKPLLAIGIAAALVVAGLANSDTYINAYPAQAAARPITLITDVARYLSTVPRDEPVVLYNNRQFYMAHWTIRLLAPQVQGTTAWEPQQLEDTLAQQQRGFLLVAVDANGAYLDHIYAEYPGGKPQRIKVHDMSHWVTAYWYEGAGLT